MLGDGRSGSGSKNPWDQLYNLLQADGSSLAERRETLQAAGMDVNNLERRVADLLRNWQVAPRPEGWLERARQARDRFEEGLSRKREWISRHVPEVFSLPPSIAEVYYRNESHPNTEADWETLWEDCEILELLERREEESEKNEFQSKNSADADRLGGASDVSPKSVRRGQGGRKSRARSSISSKKSKS